jgi:hypothetical protein
LHRLGCVGDGAARVPDRGEELPVRAAEVGGAGVDDVPDHAHRAGAVRAGRQVIHDRRVECERRAGRRREDGRAGDLVAGDSGVGESADGGAESAEEECADDDPSGGQGARRARRDSNVRHGDLRSY